MEGNIYSAFDKEIHRIIEPGKYTDEEMMKVCEEVSRSCDQFIIKIQNELGINTVNKREYTIWK